MKRACVIGAGIGGLALAIRLQCAGIATTVVDRRDHAGGRAAGHLHAGLRYEAGGATITDPAAWDELWGLSGAALVRDIELLPVRPAFRLHWPNGQHFDLTDDAATLRGEVARVAPDDLAGYEDYAAFAATLQAEGVERFAAEPFLDLRAMLRLVPRLVRLQAWRSLFGKVSSCVKSSFLRQALSFGPLLAGADPRQTSALYAVRRQRDKAGGVWVPSGGGAALIAAMVALFERAGGTLRLSDAATRIHTIGTQVQEVECASGWRERFDAVASNADLMHTYRTLLADNPRGRGMAARLARMAWTAGRFTVHFAVAGGWPGIAYQTLLFGPRWRGLLDDIFGHGVLPRDLAIILRHPGVVDPGLAPPGQSLFSATVPVAHLGKLPIDWAQVGPLLERRVLGEIGLRFIPDIHDRLIASHHTTPADEAQTAFLGSTASLQPLLRQSFFLRPHSRDDVIANLYLVGAGTHPGAVLGGGLDAALAGAKATAGLMLSDLRG